MLVSGNIFMYHSLKSGELFCFSHDSKGKGLPDSLSPWQAYGVVRPDQAPPHGLSRKAVEAGISKNGYQLWRHKKKPEATGKPASTKKI